MMKRMVSAACGIAAAAALAGAAEPGVPAYRNTALTPGERAVDLVSRMTFEEKISQFRARTAAPIKRLGVRAYNWWSEGLHGVARDGVATSFPTGLGIASTWDTNLVERMITALSDEAREKFNEPKNPHGLSYWSPTINMARDPRWGRTEETYGEDPYLAGMIAAAYVRGLQGKIPGAYKAIATPKHFLANNSEQNRHNGSSNVDARDLREYYTLAFKHAVEWARAGSIMTSYNAVNGVPMSVNTPVLDTIARRTWGFDGYFVTDCWALNDIVHRHKWRPEGWGDKPWTGEATTAYAIRAGVDLNCGEIMPKYGVPAIRQGLLTMGEADRALVRIFTARMKTGEFDTDGGPYGGTRFRGKIASDAHRLLAEEASDSAVVLLKNEGGLLPIRPGARSVVLIGDRANETILGDYSVDTPHHMSNAADGLRAALARVSPQTRFTYIEGQRVSGNGRLMNFRAPELLDKEGKPLAVFPPDQGTVVSGKANPSRWKSHGWLANKGAVIKFPAGVVPLDRDRGAKFRFKLSGAQLAGPTLVEIRAQNPDTGPLLGSVQGKGITSFNADRWDFFETYDCDANLGGGYSGDDLFLVFKPAPGARELTPEQKELIRRADLVVYYAGTRPGENGYTEEHDGSTLTLPHGQNGQIAEIAALNPNTAVYIQAVSQVDIRPFQNSVRAILWTTYNGQAQGNAAGRILTGESSPSARLPFTWYADEAELAHVTDYRIRPGAGSKGRTYWYFTGAVSFPFGYGLGYTSFAYSNLRVDQAAATPDDTLTVSFDVTNTGARAGRETAQLYVASPGAAAKARPAKRLAAFGKQTIPPGETRRFVFRVPAAGLWFWDPVKKAQTYDPGVYTLQAGPDSRACEKLTAAFTLSGALTRRMHVATAIPSGHVLVAGDPASRITTALTASYNDQSFVDLARADVRYAAADPAVAAVDAAGVVTGRKPGITTVTASVTLAGQTVSSSFPVKVVPPGK